jgi:hypothetical protein
MKSCGEEDFVPRQLSAEELQAQWDNLPEEERYAVARANWKKVSNHVMQGSKLQKVSAHSAAAKVCYKFWPSRDIFSEVIPREHFIRSMFSYTPVMTRVERYCMLTMALTFAFFCMTFWFTVDCFMVPKPGVCHTPATSTFMKIVGPFIPTWTVFFGVILGMMLAAPLPFIITALFRKFRIDEIRTESQKRMQRNFWRCKQAFGWGIALSVQAFCVYFLLLFAMQYDMTVYSKGFLSAVLQGMIHRIFTSPLARGFALAIMLAFSKYLACCDCFVIFCCPHVIPEVDVQDGQREQDAAHAQDGEDGGDDMDMDDGGGNDYDDGFDGGEDGGGFDITSGF